MPLCKKKKHCYGVFNVLFRDVLCSFMVGDKNVLEVTNKLKPKTSTDLVAYMTFINKGFRYPFFLCFEEYFSLSLEQGQLPQLWKFLVVIPIFKTVDTTLVNNYRPVSLLCGFAKGFEKVV